MRGFTLVEAMIVLSLIGVLAMVGYPALSGWQAQQAVRAASGQFLARYSLARSSAMRYGRLSQLQIDTAGDRFWVEVDTSATMTGAVDTLAPIEYVGEVFGVTMESTRSTVCFATSGLPTQALGCSPGDVTVVFSRNGVVDTVQATVLGKTLR